MEFLEKYKKNIYTKQAHILKRNCIYILYLKIAEYKIQIGNFVLGYPIFKIIEK